MRTNIEIDDELMNDALAASGAPTKREVVHEALALLIRLKRQERAIKELRGIGWEGDLEAMRLDKPRPEWG